MIYTVTLNPSLDYILTAPDFTLGKTNRLTKETLYAGGKGINVAMVLKNLGVPVKALGFVAGFTGTGFEDLVKKSGLDCDFIHLEEGCTRINVKITGKGETALNGSGPIITQADMDKLYAQLDQLQAGDFLVLSGSIPNSLPEDTYAQIMTRLEGKGILTVVDVAGAPLLHALECHPFLVKPNHTELAKCFGLDTITTPWEILKYAHKLREFGAHTVMVSRGETGAILIDPKGTVYSCVAPQGTLISSVGSGDSMVAGFLAAYISGADLTQCLKRGVCAGSATAFTEGMATKEDIESLYARM